MQKILLIAHNLRSAHNVGSLLRTADGLGVSIVYLTGYTPYPLVQGDDRMPHIAEKVHARIAKTALGAESSMKWEHRDDISALLGELKQQEVMICALEQSDTSVNLPEFVSSHPIALIVGREVEGIEPAVLAHADVTIEIPMQGAKESFNVAQAAAMALYQLTYDLRPKSR